MTWTRLSNTFAVLLLAACFIISVNRIFTRAKREADPDQVKIRFAHWQLEGGVRDAFDQVAKEYEALHPGVEVEQMAIPERISKNWAITQLVGGTAPDIIQLGGQMGTTDEVLTRYFVPLSRFVDLPNPYNAGTELAGMPWRETIIDGITSIPAYSETLLEYYGIPNSMFTIRVYYNRKLWRELLGHDSVPETFEKFIAICRKAQGFTPANGEPIIPIAGSKYNAPMVLDALFGSQTQKLKERIAPLDDLAPTPMDLGLSYLAGQWNWETPAIQSGLELMMRTGKFMQPGFLSLGRDDALFYFAQERALMISSGSWDSTSLRIQVPFEIGVFRIPLPAPDHPEYGEFTFGPTSEAGNETGLAFGITEGSQHQEVALDFLRFLTSKKTSATFSRLSGWLPAVVDVEVSELIAPFEPITEGYVAGFGPGGGLDADAKRVLDNSLYKLVGPNGSVAEFTALLNEQFGPAAVTSLQLLRRSKFRTALAQDATIGAWQVMAQDAGAEDAASARISHLMEGQTAQETEIYHMDYQMNRLGLDD